METESIYTLVDAGEQGCGKENGDLMLNGDSFSLGKWKILEMDDGGELHNNVNILRAAEMYIKYEGAINGLWSNFFIGLLIFLLLNFGFFLYFE